MPTLIRSSSFGLNSSSTKTNLICVLLMYLVSSREGQCQLFDRKAHHSRKVRPWHGEGCMMSLASSSCSIWPLLIALGCKALTRILCTPLLGTAVPGKHLPPPLVLAEAALQHTAMALLLSTKQDEMLQHTIAHWLCAMMRTNEPAIMHLLRVFWHAHSSCSGPLRNPVLTLLLDSI